MKQILLLLLVVTSTLCYSQKAEYGKLVKKGNLTEYVSKSGDLLKVGDTLIIGKPSADVGFNFITQSGEEMPPNLSDKSVVIAKLKAYGTNSQGYKVYVHFKGYGLVPVLIDYEPAMATGEVKNPNAKMTRIEAIMKLKEAKELLDLEVYSKEKYDAIKKELIPFILN